MTPWTAWCWTSPTRRRCVPRRREARLVLTTVGPFVRYGAPVLDACLDAGVSYVDIANELTAVREVLERDGRGEGPRHHGGHRGRVRSGRYRVTGPGSGRGTGRNPGPGAGRDGAGATATSAAGVRETIAALLPEGATTYVDGALVRAPFGTGATVLNFGGARRTMLPGPAGDLEAARLASGAANVSAYFGDPAPAGRRRRVLLRLRRGGRRVGPPARGAGAGG